MLVTGYLNLYHSGFYHRRGKPGDVNIHGGDIYTDRATAINHIEHGVGYITTVPVTWESPHGLSPNPSWSEPYGLVSTRRDVKNGVAPWLTTGSTPSPAYPILATLGKGESIENSEESAWLA